jgi:hypothetical protein
MADSLNTPQQRNTRTWLQFSLRGLAIALTLFAVWLGFHVASARQQAAARKVILEHGGAALFGYQIVGSGQPLQTAAALVPPSLRGALGEDLFGTVVRVNFPDGNPVDGSCLAALADLPEVSVLNTQRSRIGDADLQTLRAGTSLTHLRLIDAPITGPGLRHLQPLENLELLDLSGTRVGDDGLQYLTTLDELGYLILTGTAVTDAGIQQLARLKRLVYLNVQNTNVTADGARQLQKQLPNCQITH